MEPSNVNLHDWVLADCSYQTSSICSTEYSSMCTMDPLICPFPEVLVNLTEDSLQDEVIKTFSTSESCFDIPRFLRSLIEDTANLEKRISQMTEDAMKENMEQTLIVLTMHSLVMKIRLQATVKELECIVDKTFETEECTIEPAQPKCKGRKKKVFGERKTGNCVSSRLQERTVSCETETSMSTLIDHTSQTLLEKMHRNIEYLMDTLSLRSEVSEQVTSLGSPSPVVSSNEKTTEAWTNTMRVNLENCPTDQEIGNLSTRENIENTLRKMKQYPSNREIESDCLRILRTMEISEPSCRKIINAGCLEYLCEVFEKLEPEHEGSIEDIIHVFFTISMYPSLAKYLREDRYVEIFLKITKNAEFKELDIYCVDGLCNILVNSTDITWSLKMTRVSMEERIRKGMEKWKLGSFPSYRLTTFAGHLTRIKKYTSAIRHFSLWLVAHHTVLGSQSDIQMIRDQGGVSVLVNVLTDMHDEQLMKWARDALKILNQ